MQKTLWRWICATSEILWVWRSLSEQEDVVLGRAEDARVDARHVQQLVDLIGALAELVARHPAVVVLLGAPLRASIPPAPSTTTFMCLKAPKWKKGRASEPPAPRTSEKTTYLWQSSTCVYVSTDSTPGCARTFCLTVSMSVPTRGSYPRLMMRSAITRIRPPAPILKLRLSGLSIEGPGDPRAALRK